MGEQYCIRYLKTLRVNLKCSHHEKEMELCEVTEVIAKAKMIIALQYVSVSKQHVCFNSTQCYLSILSQ